MRTATLVRPGSENGGSKLPRGPHALPQEVVVAHQRERLMIAAAGAMAEQGYSELTVRELIDRAGVSRRTFYQLFEDKLDCVFSSLEMSFDHLSRVIEEACEIRAGWPERVAAAVSGALDFAAQFPDEAQLIVVSATTASEPKLAARGRAAHERLAALLRTGRQHGHGAGTRLDLTEQALIGAAMSIIGASLVAGELDALTRLKPELVQIVLTPYLGAREAQRVALSS